MAQRLARWQRFHQTVGDARSSIPIGSRIVRERLEELEEAYAYMSQVIKEALAEWPAVRGKGMVKAGVSG
jgi:hypothetical protein